jgi:hypothetical protein
MKMNHAGNIGGDVTPPVSDNYIYLSRDAVSIPDYTVQRQMAGSLVYNELDRI